ncbi:protein quiver-like [Ruditapes philippinarum]|uniref:protein quiver-like n=1 Tax=Ruditapes philippinarum TaxID=129788 RepID=UPI00295C01BF|nr:protein quiver-like [Ruditapes philippinarum]XP_060591512.1 protein quiver-like [Ruditapes philippinarum]XP_060591514.1 protein quiver-like [Ruditapes philippinarum]
MEYNVVTLVTVTMVIMVTMDSVRGQVDDYSDPISCYYCFGPAENSSCADPVNPKEDKGKTLTVIDCDNGICLKWTHYYGDVLYMHRTCSDRLNDFRIMMIDGVCRSEREGHGYLCMCGRHLCNSAESDHTARKLYILLSAILMVVSLTRGMPLSL